MHNGSQLGCLSTVCVRLCSFRQKKHSSGRPDSHTLLTPFWRVNPQSILDSLPATRPHADATSKRLINSRIAAVRFSVDLARRQSPSRVAILGTLLKPLRSTPCSISIPRLDDTPVRSFSGTFFWHFKSLFTLVSSSSHQPVCVLLALYCPNIHLQATALEVSVDSKLCTQPKAPSSIVLRHQHHPINLLSR